MIRLSWTQPEDLVPHALRAAQIDGVDAGTLATARVRWLAAGGSDIAPVSGATPERASAELRALGREMLAEIDTWEVSPEIAANEPDGFVEIIASASASASAAAASAAASGGSAPGASAAPAANAEVSSMPASGSTSDLAERADRADRADRVHGAWLGRAAGCLLGKPVEKIPREGIRAIAESTGNWPIAGYFTERGLDDEIARRYPWNRRSRPTSLVENIDGMPEDDDLNFPLIALDLLERLGRDFTTDDVAQSWLANLPGGRVFTAERIVYRNLLDGYEPDEAGRVANPFQDWIGAQIRTDVYGWVSPGDAREAARLAYADARLSHSRNGVYGALFAAACCSAALVASSVQDVIDAGLGVVPARSRYAAAIRRGVELGGSDLSLDDALDAIYADYGDLHWVHAVNNSALLAFALVRGDGDFARTITTAVSGGWDTDSVGATAGSIAGALTGARGLPGAWIEPLHNRLATSVPGFDAVTFDSLAARTLALVREA